MEDPKLMTTYAFKGREFLIKMNVVNNQTLDISITDKYSGEDWQGSYDPAYIECLTQRTGNFKQFHIFATMLKSGLLKTSDCVSLDLLTFEDLEILRSRRGKPFNHKTTNTNQNNRRYLILTYSVEFDRIHYPLPLDYCGPPDPQLLQTIIRRLENEVYRLQEQLSENSNSKVVMKLQQRLDELTDENMALTREIKRISRKKSESSQIKFLNDAIKSLEESVNNERTSHSKLVKELQLENEKLRQELQSLSRRKHVSRFEQNRRSDPVLYLKQVGNKSGSGDCPFRRKINSSPLRIESWEATVHQKNLVERRSTSRESSKKLSKSRKKKSCRSRSISSQNSKCSSRASSTSSKPKQIQSSTLYQSKVRVDTMHRLRKSKAKIGDITDRIVELEKKLREKL